MAKKKELKEPEYTAQERIEAEVDILDNLTDALVKLNEAHGNAIAAFGENHERTRRILNAWTDVYTLVEESGAIRREQMRS